MKLTCSSAHHTEPLCGRGGKPFQHYSDSPTWLLWAVTTHVGWQRQEDACQCRERLPCKLCSRSRALPGNFASKGKVSSSDINVSWKKKNWSTQAGVEGTEVMSRNTINFTQKQCVHHWINVLHFIMNCLPQGIDWGNVGPLFSCANPLALKMPLLKREPSYTVGGSVNCCSHYVEQYGGSLKN